MSYIAAILCAPTVLLYTKASSPLSRQRLTLQEPATTSRYDAAADTASDAYVNALHGKDKVAEGAGQAADQAKQQVSNAQRLRAGGLFTKCDVCCI